MAQKGDEMTVTFNSEAPLRWGTHRRTGSRSRRGGECYIPIPKAEAKRLQLRNSNCGEGFGINLYHAHSIDGIYQGILKSAGNSKRGDIYAKQFEGKGCLRALKPWFIYNQAQIGDKVHIRWVTDIEVELTFIKGNNRIIR